MHFRKICAAMLILTISLTSVVSPSYSQTLEEKRKVPMNESLNAKPEVVNEAGTIPQPETLAEEPALPDPKNKFNEAPYSVALPNESISTLSGSLTLESTDMTLVGRNGLDFELIRQYDSNSSQFYRLHEKGYAFPTFEQLRFGLGSGWSWKIPVIERNGFDLNVHFPGAGTLTTESCCTITNYPWKEITITQNTREVTIGGIDSEYRIDTLQDGRIYHFSSNGRLLQISDTMGNYIQFFYKSDQLIKITNSIGNSIDITYGERLTPYVSSKVTITSGNKKVEYSHFLGATGGPLLGTVTEYGDGTTPNRRTTYNYTIKPAKYNLSSSIPTYDNPYALITSVLHPTGAVSSYQYESQPYRRVVGYNGKNEVYRIQNVANQLHYTDGTSETKNSVGITYVGDMGAHTADEDNPSFSTILTEGGIKSTYEYEKYIYARSLTDRSKYRYNFFQKRLLRVAGAEEEETNYSYTQKKMGRNLPTSTTVVRRQNGVASSPVTTGRTYDDYKNVSNDRKAMGAATSNMYDPLSHLLTAVYEPVNSINKQTTVTRYERFPSTTGKGRLIQESRSTDINGTVLTKQNYDYDSYGNPTLVQTMDGNQVNTSTFEYGIAYQSAFPTKYTVQTTNADGIKQSVNKQYEYDIQTGQITRSVDGNSHSLSYRYDPFGRVTHYGYSDGTSVSIHYDDIKNEIRATDELGFTTYVKFNQLGWKYETGYTDAQCVDHAQSTYEYDAYGNMIWSEDAMGNRTTYSYDSWHRLQKTIDADGGQSVVGYDDINRTQTQTDPDGRQIIDSYDLLGRKTKSEWVTSAGRQLIEQNTFTDAGLTLTSTDGKGQVTSFEYDPLGNLTAVVDALGKKTQYSYSMTGNLVKTTYPDGQSVQKLYDELGRVIKSTDPLGAVEKFAYDGNGNPIRYQNRKGQRFTYEYNARNLPTKKTGPDETIAFAYDEKGRRISMTDGTGGTSYSYGALDELLSVTTPDGKTIRYAYDNALNRVQMIDPFGSELKYGYDAQNRLDKVETNGQDTPLADYTYSKGGVLTQATLANGIVIDSTVDQTKHLTALIQKDVNGSVLNRFSYQYDKNGNQVRRTENGTTHAFTYDPLNRIETSTQFTESYRYDDRGNRKTQSTMQAPSISDATYAFDGWDRLRQVKLGDGTEVTYQYNGDGLLYQRTANGETVRYYYDGPNMIAEATVHTDGTVELKARYVRGNRLIAREDASGNRAFYTHNGHGDVTELRDSAGDVRNTYTYDIWGNPLSTEEQVENPFRYAGEFWDDTAELQYLRARWYDPAQGRFLNEDTYEGEVQDHLSLNLYSYVTNNPLGFIDSSGNKPEEIPFEYNNSTSEYQRIELEDTLTMKVANGLKRFRYSNSTSTKAALITDVVKYFLGELVQSAVADPIWKFNPMDRGNAIEFVLSETDYEDWYYVGREYNGYFPVVDFQKGMNVVSLKTIDPSRYGDNGKSQIQTYINKLAFTPMRINQKYVINRDRILDIRVPSGQISLIEDYLDDLDQYGIIIKVGEF